jgi:hypothetical protein
MRLYGVHLFLVRALADDRLVCVGGDCCPPPLLLLIFEQRRQQPAVLQYDKSIIKQMADDENREMEAEHT